MHELRSPVRSLPEPQGQSNRVHRALGSRMPVSLALDWTPQARMRLGSTRRWRPQRFPNPLPRPATFTS